MFQSKNLLCRTLASCIVFSFLLVLFSVSTIAPSTDNSIICPEKAYLQIQFSKQVEFFDRAEFLPPRPTHIYEKHNSRNVITPKHLQLHHKEILQLLTTAYIFYIVLWLFSRTITYSQKFIIRYIQNQDGRKDKLPFIVMLNQTICGGKTYENYGNADNFSYLFRWIARSGLVYFLQWHSAETER